MLLLTLALLLGIVGSAFTVETPLQAILIGGPYGNTCYFDGLNPFDNWWYIQRCRAGFNTYY